jgi:EAL domain-containing protein (putative c-di-GMP-specific phosphodiesterase class I)/GGDEF domain-containing protein
MWSILEPEAFMPRVTYNLRSGARSAGLLVLQIVNFRRLSGSLGDSPAAQVIDEMLARLAGLRVAAKPGQRPCTLAVSRIAQDEMAIFIQGVQSAADVADMARAAAAVLAPPVTVAGHVVGLDVHVGAAGPMDVHSAEDMLRLARIALEDTRRGGSRIASYTPDMLASAGERLALETSLRHALEHDRELYLLYQPQVSFKTGRIEAVEALVRWDHPGIGPTLPGHFISFAEERGMGLAICDWVMTHACRQMRDWRGEGLGHLGMSINLSSDGLEIGHIAARLGAILEETGASADLLELEITERFTMDDAGRSISAFERLRSLGVSLALDDFGTGYSSLTQLQQLPVNRLKIDRSFVYRLAEGGQHTALVNGIIGLAHGLGMSVVAEGVETEQQWGILANLGCDSFQGFFFAQPMHADALAHMIRSTSSTSTIASKS